MTTTDDLVSNLCAEFSRMTGIPQERLLQHVVEATATRTEHIQTAFGPITMIASPLMPRNRVMLLPTNDQSLATAGAGLPKP